MSLCSAFRQKTSIVWALISDGKRAYIFKYRKDEKVFAALGVLTQPAYSVSARAIFQEFFASKDNEVNRFIVTLADKLNQSHNAYDQKGALFTLQKENPIASMDKAIQKRRPLGSGNAAYGYSDRISAKA